MVLKLLSLKTKQPSPTKKKQTLEYWALLCIENSGCFPLWFIFFTHFLPTCYFNRRWVLQQLIQETSLPSFMTKGNLGIIPAERTQQLIREEMEVCGEAAGRYPSNYNAWSHRIWVLQRLAKLDTKVGCYFVSLGTLLSAI